MPEHHYAEVVLDETWALAEAATPLRRRWERGFSRSSGVAGRSVVESTTDPEAAPAWLRERLVADPVLSSLRDGILDRLIGRVSYALVARIALTHFVQDDEEALRSVIRISAAEEHEHGILASSSSLEDDLERMAPDRADRGVVLEKPDLPTLWIEGSGGVLLHEAIGHPAGLAEGVSWPDWLEVIDDPSRCPFESHRKGRPAATRDLMREAPAALRRASFRDHPLPRMTHLIARAAGAPFELPEQYIEIRRTSGGDWDPLTDHIRIDVVEARLVQSAGLFPIRPFSITARRSEIATSLRGARGEPSRYPGVLCSELGQQLPVGTSAPDLLLGALP